MIRSNTPTIARPVSSRRSLGHKIRWSAVALMLAAIGQLDAAPLELKTQGNQIIEKASGKRVRLVGANFSGLEDGFNVNFLNSLDVIKGTWKANVIRLPVSDWRWMNSDLTARAAYRAQIDAIIQRATALDIHVIFDLHNYGKTLASDTAFWTNAAAVYANNPTVLFGLFNEPHGTGGWAYWRNGETGRPGLQGLLNAVRATGANNIVLAAGGEWGYNLTGVVPGYDGLPNGYALTDTTSGNGVVYDSHVYPWKTYIQNSVGTAALYYPVLLGEFAHPSGTNFENHATFETHTTWMPRMMDWINTNNLHWVGWNFSTAAHPAMLTDWSYTPTSHWGDYALSHMQSYADPTARRVVGGTVIGTPGTKGSPTSGVISDYSRGAVAPFGNSYAFYFDAATQSGGWTGLDLGTPTRITQIKYMPRQVAAASAGTGAALMVNGVFEGSNSPTFSSGNVTLYTVPATPLANDTSKVFTTAAVANTGTYRYVRYRGPADSHCNVASILFYTGDDSGPGVNDDVIIIDNGGTGCVYTPSNGWANIDAPGHHGSHMVHDGGASKGAKTIRYTPTIMKTGRYEVFTMWNDNNPRHTAVPYIITHAGPASPETVTRNQNNFGETWQSLGTYTFAAGGTGNVLLTTTGTTGFYVTADAVKFVYRPDIILDKDAANTPGIVAVGGWASSSTSGGHEGDSYHDGGTGTGKSVTFTPTIPEAGQYKVSLWWTQGTNRAPNAAVTVNHSGGSFSTTVNQTANGGKWNDLPGTTTFTFAAGTTGSVVISNTSATGHVIADAVKFEKVN